MFKTARQHLILIGFSTLLAGFSLASVILFTDPMSGTVTRLFFYLSLLLTLLGVFTIIGLTIRQMFFQGMYVTNLGHSFRQALLVSLLLTSSMWLQSKSLLYWWIELSLVFLFAMVEVLLNIKN